MKKMSLSLLLVVLGVAGFAAEEKAVPVAPEKPAEAKTEAKKAAKAVWLTDFAAAREASRQSGKPIYMLFTGSDWCPYCLRLEKEVLATPAFAQFAQDNLILMYVDFPRRKAIAPAQRQANSTLSQQYDAEGFPTAVLVNADGKVLTRFDGYAPGSGKAYLKNLIAKGKEFRQTPVKPEAAPVKPEAAAPAAR